MKKFFTDIGSLLGGLFELLVGILLLINPAGFTRGIIIAAGIVLGVMGIRLIVQYFSVNALEAARSRALVKGLCALLAGLFCVFKSQWFVATFPILTVIYGIILLILGLGKAQITCDMLRLHLQKWFLDAASAVLTLACAVIILLNPFEATAVLWIFIGVTLIVEAVLDIVIALFCKGGNESFFEG